MPRITATANGVVVAETKDYEEVDGNFYFPPNSLKEGHFTTTSTTSKCPYKGTANYYTVTTGKTEIKDAAWYYPEPKAGMEKIKGYVAFYKSKVDIESHDS